MMTRLPVAALTGAALLLSACVSGPAPSRAQRPTTTGMRPASNDHRSTPAPAAQAGDLMGRDQAALIALFGNPRLTTQDGAATRLQFSGERCVLDAYLYARTQGAPPTVAHVDTRTPDGADMDRAGCIAALRRR
jgi:hypothetical protein